MPAFGEKVFGRQLAQSRPSATSAASVYSPGEQIVTQIQSIVVSNTGTGNLRFSIYHDEDGTTYDQTTALYFQEALNSKTNKTIQFNYGSGIWMRDTSGNLAVQTDTANDATFTVYGIEHHVEETVN